MTLPPRKDHTDPKTKKDNAVLILFAHPALQKSRVNRRLIQVVRDIEGVTLHDLYEAYPDFHIDVPNEQDLLVKSDIIVFQHPFFWFSTPSLLKEWQDLVLEHGWAYGREGTALRGKMLMSAITTGGSEAGYQKDGFNKCTMGEFLRPIERTAKLCGMEYLPPFVVHGTHRMTDEMIAGHAEDYRRVITALRDGEIDFDEIRRYSRLNASMDEILVRPGKE